LKSARKPLLEFTLFFTWEFPVFKTFAASLLLLCGSLSVSAANAAQLPATQIPVTPTAKPQQTTSTPASAPTEPQTQHPLTSADLEAFFDGIIPMQLERSDIAGATVLVMKDGQVLLQKGYGFADEKKRTPVDPATTLFRLASISKLSTWISVMQLQEQGKLDIDTDVNQYLDFQIRPAFGKPITLRNLMTHTGGFEEENNDVIIIDPKYAISLRDFLIRNQPERLFSPGTIPGYSNYGVGLASYIVQRVSGEPFEQYTERHIYTPLKMMHSTFYQPLPKTLTASEGYPEDSTKKPIGFEIFNPVGAGGYSSTAADMGRLGLALLNGGELDGARILKPETLAAMWTPQFRASNSMPPIDMGFYETWRNNLRWIGHGGDLIAFHSLFVVEPTQKLVLFVSFNSAGSASKPRPEIINMFSDRYFPVPQHQTFATLTRAQLKEPAGMYQSTRRADSTKLKMASLAMQRGVSIDKDGNLILEDAKDLRGHQVKFKPLGNDLWQEVDGQQLLFAIRDERGKVVRLATNFAGAQLQRVPWYENKKLILPMLGCSFAILIAVILAALLRTGRRAFLRKRPSPAEPKGTVWLPFLSQLAAWLWVGLVGSIMGFIAYKGDDLLPPTPAWDKYFLLINCVVVVLLLLSVFAIFSGIRVWTRNLRLITKVKFSLVALACAILSWFAIHWHLIGQISRI
jgi:CubicO group peptidase (beta-lactamase class C family)